MKKGQFSDFKLPEFVQKYHQNILEGQWQVPQTSEILNHLVHKYAISFTIFGGN